MTDATVVTHHGAMTSITSSWRSNVESFRKGLEDGLNDDGSPADYGSLDGAAKLTSDLSGILVYGFLLARPGVGLVPWGDRAGIALTLLAAGLALGARRFQGRRLLSSVQTLGVIGILMWIGRTDVTTTSIVLIGSLLITVVTEARNHPIIYGMVAGITAGGVIIGLLDVQLNEGGELILSGKPWTPDGVAHESLLIAAMVFITALLHFSRSQWARQQERAEAAEEARDRAVADERARIARELHDVVSHHVTAMTLQAEAAIATGDKGALNAISTSGREALGELRRMLGVLRQPEIAGGAAAPDELVPQPDLSGIDRIAERAGASIDVTVTREGHVVALPAGVELCAYRIVQEAITNVGKHSDAHRATVTLRYEPERLTVEVIDDGSPLRDPRLRGAGHGLIGMQERVALLGGELETGPATGGGFRVAARLPLER